MVADFWPFAARIDRVHEPLRRVRRDFLTLAVELRDRSEARHALGPGARLPGEYFP